MRAVARAGRRPSRASLATARAWERISSSGLVRAFQGPLGSRAVPCSKGIMTVRMSWRATLCKDGVYEEDVEGDGGGVAHTLLP